VIGASVAGAACVGVLGLYVLYRRKAKGSKTTKVSAEVVNTVPTTGPQRRDDWYAASMKQSERAIPVLYSDSRYSENRSSSAAHSSSYNISSLHTSERSVDKNVKKNVVVEDQRTNSSSDDSSTGFGLRHTRALSDSSGGDNSDSSAYSSESDV